MRWIREPVRFLPLLLAALSACGQAPGEFAYVKVDGQEFDIMRGSVADTARIPIAQHPALDYRPSWTPDGSRIVFYSDRRWRYDPDIFVVDAAGGEPRNLTPFSSEEVSPAAGPDGRIAFVSDRDGDREIFVMDADGGNVERITNNEERYDDHPAWSPDGTRIAYTSVEYDDADIFVADVATLETHRLAGRPGLDAMPAWSPDGRFIAFHGAIRDTMSLWVAGADGSGLRRLPNVDVDERHPNWSPDGEWLIYTASTEVGGVLESDLWMTTPDGTRRYRLTDEPGREEAAAWKPGTRVPDMRDREPDATAAPLPGEAMHFTPDWPAIATLIVERMQLAAGERVLLVGRPNRFLPLVPLLRDAVVAAGGTDLGALSVSDEPFPGDSTQFLRWAANAADRAALTALLAANVDVAVMLPESHLGEAYGIMQDVLRTGRGRTVHFHWDGALRQDGTEIPSTGEDEGSVPHDVIDALYQRAVLEADLDRIAGFQRMFAEDLRGGEVRVTTEAGTDLSFRVGDRPVTRQDGDASAARARQARNLIDREVEIPAGAVRVAPLEESVNGTIAVPVSTWSGQRVEGLVMRFERGRLVDWTATSGADAVRAELEQAGEPATRFREFALGFNPLLAVPPGGDWIPYYGYGAGVVRLSLGDNTELGGQVTGGYVRWSFFTDATVEVGRTLWVAEGRALFLEPDAADAGR